MNAYETVDSIETLEACIARARAAEERYNTYTQEEVDRIFRAAAMAAAKARIPLSKLAVAETGMGIVEDKVIKNHYAAEYIYNAYKDTKTCGVIEEDKAYGIQRIAEPVGVIAAVIPTTNPTSTAIFKCLLALKTRNAIVITPHPRAKACTVAAAKLILEAAVSAGAPDGIIAWIDEPSLDMTSTVMQKSDLILATGGPGMVKAAYSSGKPAIGVGAGNTPAVIDDSADLLLAVSSIIHSKSFDNGMICASEQAVIVLEAIYTAAYEEFKRRGCYFLAPDEKEKVKKILFKNSALTPESVGKSAKEIAKLANIDVPSSTKILMAEFESIEASAELSHEKLSPVLAVYRAKDFDDALDKAEHLVKNGGLGHTASVYLNEKTAEHKLRLFSARMKACRILVNTPAAHGGIGDMYNFKLAPSLTLGCGTWGGNSLTENVGVMQLLNIKTVAERRENMLWFRTPPKIYLKKGSLPVALEELPREYGAKRVFIVTDRFLYQNGHLTPVTDKLSEMGLLYSVFFRITPDPTLSDVKEGTKDMQAFAPDAVIAFGGGSAMDAAKIMWLLYEHPEESFENMAMRFLDIRKRIHRFPKMGSKACFIAIPTSSGTGSEVTPFAVITDEESGTKYPIADYALMPHMAIVDPDLHMSAPRSLTAAAGIDAVVHALEAYTAMLATDYTDALAIRALQLLFRYLPRAYENGMTDSEARERVANAATMAGMAFANAFLGICHSMAHKLGAFFSLPHGIANALLIEDVIRFNAAEAPEKMGSFPQYTHPNACSRYAEIADALALKGTTDMEKTNSLIKAIAALKKELGIHASIKAYGIDKDDFLSKLDKMTEEAFDDQCTGANPRYPLMTEIREIYLSAYDGHTADQKDTL